ncbi:MAG: pyridoxal-phosphate dependent enzyme, partial [Limisphaerales bacterium]
MSIWRWADHWETLPEAARLTLGEGNTPLLRSRSIGPAAGLKNLFFKLETTNPSGSYKDRFAAAAISHMIAREQSTCVATSSGNTGAALATYCAAGKIQCRIAIVETAPEAK